ncbi:nuclear transport factor 2 family protein [Catalinimonas alkaloidigena]|nr:nuclear transport factor 2 family protein [Catalinimonas alkaloidigena]
MDTHLIQNEIVRKAFEAWQRADTAAWFSYFTPDATLLDDGHPRDFQKFSTEAIGRERFTRLDKVEADGTHLYGQFHSDTWGNFKTYFKFRLTPEGKIEQLEIGQADY